MSKKKQKQAATQAIADPTIPCSGEPLPGAPASLPEPAEAPDAILPAADATTTLDRTRLQEALETARHAATSLGSPAPEAEDLTLIMSPKDLHATRPMRVLKPPPEPPAPEYPGEATPAGTTPDAHHLPSEDTTHPSLHLSAFPEASEHTLILPQGMSPEPTPAEALAPPPPAAPTDDPVPTRPLGGFPPADEHTHPGVPSPGPGWRTEATVRMRTHELPPPSKAVKSATAPETLSAQEPAAPPVPNPLAATQIIPVANAPAPEAPSAPAEVPAAATLRVPLAELPLPVAPPAEEPTVALHAHEPAAPPVPNPLAATQIIPVADAPAPEAPSAPAEAPAAATLRVPLAELPLPEAPPSGEPTVALHANEPAATLQVPLASLPVPEVRPQVAPPFLVNPLPQEPPVGPRELPEVAHPRWAPPLAVAPPVEPSRMEPPPVESRSRLPWILGAALMGLALLAGGLWLMLARSTGGKGDEAPPDLAQAPAEIRAYVDKANTGDTAAMRALGTRYYYGLGVPQNRTEGVKWFRKAAAAGSLAAQEELRAIETGQKQ